MEGWQSRDYQPTHFAQGPIFIVRVLSRARCIADAWRHPRSQRTRSRLRLSDPASVRVYRSIDSAPSRHNGSVPGPASQDIDLCAFGVGLHGTRWLTGTLAHELREQHQRPLQPVWVRSCFTCFSTHRAQVSNPRPPHYRSASLTTRTGCGAFN